MKYELFYEVEPHQVIDIVSDYLPFNEENRRIYSGYSNYTNDNYDYGYIGPDCLGRLSWMPSRPPLKIYPDEDAPIKAYDYHTADINHRETYREIKTHFKPLYYSKSYDGLLARIYLPHEAQFELKKLISKEIYKQLPDTEDTTILIQDTYDTIIKWHKKGEYHRDSFDFGYFCQIKSEDYPCLDFKIPTREFWNRYG